MKDDRACMTLNVCNLLNWQLACRCNEMAITILPINQSGLETCRRLHGVCPAGSTSQP